VDLARATWKLVLLELTPPGAGATREARLILHVENTGMATWYQVAQHVFRRAGRPELLTPCTTADFPRPAKRPAWSVLDTTRSDNLLGPLPGWEDALDRFLDEIEEPRHA
jgi:dTDP-4-dehydrorhamnose reductase